MHQRDVWPTLGMTSPMLCGLIMSPVGIDFAHELYCKCLHFDIYRLGCIGQAISITRCIFSRCYVFFYNGIALFRNHKCMMHISSVFSICTIVLCTIIVGSMVFEVSVKSTFCLLFTLVMMGDFVMV